MAKYEVCPQCEGEGSYVNPAIDSGGLTAEDFEDRDFEEDYFRGTYDVPCQMCHGKRVVIQEDVEEYQDRLADHRLMLAEQGIMYGDSRI